MFFHLRLGLTFTWDGLSSVSHATLKNGLVFPKRLFSVLALFIANYHLTLRLKVGTSAFGASYPILHSLRPATFVQIDLEWLPKFRPLFLGVLERFPRSLTPFITTYLAG